MKPTARLRSYLAIAGSSVLAISSAQAQTFTWDGEGGDAFFGTGLNWVGNSTPGVGSGVILQFAGSVNTGPNNNYSTGDNFGEWWLLSGASPFTITGNGFGLFNKIENSSSSLFTINTAGIYARDGSMEINPVGGDITIGSSTAIELDGNTTLDVFDGSNNRTLTIDGTLSNGNGLGGNGAIELNQTATVILTGTNDYGGSVLNNSSKLRIGAGSTTGTLGVGNVTLNDTSSLFFNRSNDLTVTNLITGTGSVTKQGAGVLTLNNASNSYSGQLTVSAGTLAIGAINNISANGNLGNSALAVILGSTGNTGTLRYTGGNASSTKPFTMATDGTGAFDVSTGATALTLSGLIDGSGGLTKTGGGTLVLLRNSGSNSYAGITTLSAGTLQGNTGTSLIAAIANPFGTTALQLNGGTLQLRADSAASGAAADTIAWNNNTTVGGNVTINVERAGGSGSNKIHQLGTLSIGAHILTATDVSSANHDLRFGATTLTGNATFNVTNTGGAMNLTLGAVGESGGARSLSKSGGATLTITGIASNTGGMAVSAGTLSLTNSSNSFTGGLTISGGGAVLVAADGNLGNTSNGIQFTGTGALLGSTSGISLASTRTITVDNSAIATLADNNVNNNPFTYTVGGKITGAGGVQVGHYNLGSGVTNFDNTANDFTGSLTLGTNATRTLNYSGFTLNIASLADGIGYGNIIFGQGNAVATSTASFAWSSTANAPLVLNNRRIQLDGTVETAALRNNNGSASNTITVNTDLLVSRAGNKTLTLGGSNTGTNTFAGLISNSASPLATISLTKADAGLWILTNTANSYTGSTTVSGGTLQVSSLADGGNNSLIGASTSAAGSLILNGGTLRYTGAAVDTDRLFSLQASSTIDASGSGALNFENTGSMGFNGGTAAKTLTLTGTNTGNNTLAAVIGNNTGTTAINKTGIGTWVLSGANTNTGNTTLSGGGTLVLDYGTNDDSKIAGVLNLNAGILTLNGGTHEEAVTSTTISTAGGHTTIALSGGRTAAMNLAAITRTFSGSAAGGTLSFAADNIGKTSSGNNTAGILGGWATVGSNWATNSAGSIVALGSYATFATSGTSLTSNYQLTGSSALTGNLTASTLRISSDGDGQSLNLGASRTLALGQQSSSIAGGLLYTGGGTLNTYTITGTGTSRIQNSNGNQETLFHIYAGTLNADVLVGNGSGCVTKTGVGTLVLQKANDYTGATYVNQGVVRAENNTALGAASSGTNSTFVFNGAALELSNSAAIGAEALTITGSGVSSGGALRNVTGNTSSYGGAITLGAGGARINSDASGALTLTGGITTSLFNDVTFGGAGNTTVQTAAINGAGGLIKDGAGTTTLTATNTYTGVTSVNEGKLLINGSTSASSAVSVASGAALGGDGTVGASATFDNGSIFAWNLSVTDPGDTGSATVNDTLAVTGSLVDGGAAGGAVFKIVLAGAQTFADTFWTSNQSWTNVLTSGNSLALETLFTSFSYENASGVIAGPTGGSAFSLSGTTLNFSSIPEPTSALAGLLLTAGLLRRRRQGYDGQGRRRA